MRYIKPEYYDDFKCIADRCPDTCCAGWQIVIDEDSLKRYETEIKRCGRQCEKESCMAVCGSYGAFGERLDASIDWQEGVFYHKDNKRCTFLNEQNLCDLYTALGPEALCDTCRDYPRHTEEFEGLRELSLSLSCPVAAERILSEKNFPAFVEYETDEPEELADEFEDFDLLLFTQLEDTRKVAFAILQETDVAFTAKLQRILSLAQEIDDCVGEGRFSDIDEVIGKYESGESGQDTIPESRYSSFKENFAVFEQMELLREEWQEKRDSVWKLLYAEDEEHYFEVVERFEAHAEKNGIEGVSLEQIATNLMVSFVYTWFCGAVYSGWVYSKMAMAAFCTCYILEFIMAEWLRQGEHITFADCVEITYRFTREVEHSDINLGIMEEWFIDEP